MCCPTITNNLPTTALRLGSEVRADDILQLVRAKKVLSLDHLVSADSRRAYHASLREALEPLVCVVNKDPVLVARLSFFDWRRRWQLEVYIGEVVEVAGIVYRLYLDWYCGGALPDVLPVNSLRETLAMKNGETHYATSSTLIQAAHYPTSLHTPTKAAHYATSLHSPSTSGALRYFPLYANTSGTLRCYHIKRRQQDTVTPEIIRTPTLTIHFSL